MTKSATRPPVARRRLARAVGALALLCVGSVFLQKGVLADGAAKDDGDEDRADREHPIVTPARVVVQDGHNVVRLDEQALRRAGIRTVALRRTAQALSARAYAVVVDLQPLAQGVAALQAAQAQLAGAQARLAASQAEYQRARQLFEQEQNVSAAQLQAAQAASAADQAALAAAQAQVDASLAPLRLAWGAELVGALQAGTVAAANPLGDLLERRLQLLRVILPPDGTLARAPAQARLVLDGGATVALRLLGPSLQGDPRLAGRGFHYLATARDALVPGAYLPVELPSGGAIQAARVPASAVLWWQGRAWFFERQGNGDFARRAIAADADESADGVIADLPDGAQVVVQGAQVLLSEELRAENYSTDVGGR